MTVGGGASTLRPSRNTAPDGRVDETGDDLQQRGLAAAGGADDGHEAAALDVEIDAVERDRGAARRSEGLAEAANAQERPGRVRHRQQAQGTVSTRRETSIGVFSSPYFRISSIVRAVSATFTAVPNRGSSTLSLSAGLRPVYC